MNQVNLDTLPESTQQFILESVADPGGSTVVKDGRPLAHVTPAATTSDGSPEGDWTAAKDRRRCDLIDREIDGALTADERAELEDLQGQMLRHRHRVAPLPLAHAGRLLAELERKAAAAGSSP
jgi:hypothetical protein